MKKLFMIFLIFSGCMTPVIASKKFDGEWFFLESKEGETMACLKQPDVMKLRELMLRCDDESR